jgi:hypothetical protein
MRLPPRPTVYEINTAVWLERLGRTLGAVPAQEWDRLAALPVDAVWLMGVWRRSPAGLAIAEADPGLDAGNRAALPDLRPGDVIGSPYCVRNYVADDRFGGPAALAHARAELARRGLGLRAQSGDRDLMQPVALREVRERLVTRDDLAPRAVREAAPIATAE